jgi:hypothetical protein
MYHIKLTLLVVLTMIIIIIAKTISQDFWHLIDELQVIFIHFPIYNFDFHILIVSIKLTVFLGC